MIVANGHEFGFRKVLRAIEECCQHLFELAQAPFWNADEARKENFALRQLLCQLRGYNLSRQIVREIAQRFKSILGVMGVQFTRTRELLRRYLRQYRIAARYHVQLPYTPEVSCTR